MFQFKKQHNHENKKNTHHKYACLISWSNVVEAQQWVNVLNETGSENNAVWQSCK